MAQTDARQQFLVSGDHLLRFLPDFFRFRERFEPEKRNVGGRTTRQTGAAGGFMKQLQVALNWPAGWAIITVEKLPDQGTVILLGII